MSIISIGEVIINFWDVIKGYWYVLLIAYVPLRIVEAIIKSILRRMFGVMVGPFKNIKKLLAKVSVFDWVLITLLIICYGIITYLIIALYA